MKMKDWRARCIICAKETKVQEEKPIRWDNDPHYYNATPAEAYSSQFGRMQSMEDGETLLCEEHKHLRGKCVVCGDHISSTDHLDDRESFPYYQDLFIHNTCRATIYFEPFPGEEELNVNKLLKMLG